MKKDTLSGVGWGDMALRQIVGRWIIMSLIFFVFFPAGLVLDCMLLWDQDRQQLWDKLPGTIVVNGDPGGGPSSTAGAAVVSTPSPTDDLSLANGGSIGGSSSTSAPTPRPTPDGPNVAVDPREPAGPGVDAPQQDSAEQATSVMFESPSQSADEAPSLAPPDGSPSEPAPSPDPTDPTNWRPPTTSAP